MNVWVGTKVTWCWYEIRP